VGKEDDLVWRVGELHLRLPLLPLLPRLLLAYFRVAGAGLVGLDVSANHDVPGVERAAYEMQFFHHPLHLLQNIREGHLRSKA